MVGVKGQAAGLHTWRSQMPSQQSEAKVQLLLLPVGMQQRLSGMASGEPHTIALQQSESWVQRWLAEQPQYTTLLMMLLVSLNSTMFLFSSTSMEKNRDASTSGQVTLLTVMFD